MVPAAIHRFGAGRAALGAGIVTGLTYLARKLLSAKEKKPTMGTCESGSCGRTVVVPLLVGAIAGVAAVLLLAPRARRESAARIRELSRDLKERASATVDAAQVGFPSSVSRGRDLVDEGRAEISAATEAGEGAWTRRTTRVPGCGQARAAP